MVTHTVNTHEAKSRLSELIRFVERGEDVVLARNGRPVARLVAWEEVPPTRKPGAWAGQVEYQGDVVGPDPEIAALFEESASRVER